jgi:hypothetical protein
MKMITLIATFLSATVAFAYPAMNDTATFTATISNGVQTMNAIVEVTITDFNASANQYTLTQVATVQGQVQTDQSVVGADELMSQAVVLQILGNCAAAGGVDETVTVGAGTFNTCKITQTSSAGDTMMVNIADVTFGFVKQASFEAASNQSTVLEMQSHKSGN